MSFYWFKIQRTIDLGATPTNSLRHVFDIFMLHILKHCLNAALYFYLKQWRAKQNFDFCYLYRIFLDCKDWKEIFSQNINGNSLVHNYRPCQNIIYCYIYIFMLGIWYEFVSFNNETSPLTLPTSMHKQFHAEYNINK